MEKKISQNVFNTILSQVFPLTENAGNSIKDDKSTYHAYPVSTGSSDFAGSYVPAPYKFGGNLTCTGSSQSANL